MTPLRLDTARTALVAALIVMSGLFWASSARMHVEIDGTRYHFLDDDQMISMRYARNLAEGHGPVWNPGERVEGYTNFGWMLVMSAVHFAGAPDATASWWVRSVNWSLACAVLLLSAVLLAELGVTGAPAAAALLALAASTDLLFWSINGFETTLLTAVFLWALLRVFRETASGTGAPHWTTFLLAGLLPVVRSDGFDLTTGIVLVALALGRRATGWRCLFTLLPLAGHEAFRVWYYGDWLPNTFYLKVAGRTGLAAAAAGNLKAYAATYTVVLVLATAGAIVSADRRLRLLAALPLAAVAKLFFTGPDIFPGFRFLAPYLPVLLAAAALAIARLSGEVRALRPTLATLVLLATTFNAGVSGRRAFADLVSVNGVPAANTVAGVLVARHTGPNARMAVTAAGCISYFARRDAIDVLGKSDRHVARLPARDGAPTGHNRFDPSWSLRSEPDLVATFAPDAYTHAVVAAVKTPTRPRTLDFTTALVLDPLFVSAYRDHPVPIQYLLDRNSLYVNARSPELARVGGWREPRVEP